ncbi:MAG TPA: hypothetical protein VIT67_06895 [Povalibacter sp.]
MRTTVAGVAVSVLLTCAAVHADPVVERKSWQQSYPVMGATPELVVRNIWGNVRVRPGAAGVIVVSAVETRSARTVADFEKSREQLQLEVSASADGVSLLVDKPDRDGRREVCQGCSLELQFDISVPPHALVDVRTITDGRVEVTGLRGPVSAGNVNGAVAVSGVTECSSIDSVNGSLDVTFARAPSGNCSLKTINGAITVGLPAGAGLDAILDLGHGQIETEFEVDAMTVPVKVEKNRQQDYWRYRLQQSAGLRVGAGGPAFTFASLNGDVRILKNK